MTKMHRPRTLRSRLFSWFVGAILLAMLTSSLVVMATRPEQANVVDAVARNMAAELERVWDDEAATRSYLAEVRRVTGLDAKLVRDPRLLPARVHRLAERGTAIVPEGPRHVFVPVLRAGTVVGALEIYRFGIGWTPAGWWRFVLALLLVLGVLSAMAGAIADQLARPLERLADAADRFGGGDLKARTRSDGTRRRWVAREVLEVATSFNRMADRVEAMVRSQRELLGAISHELRSPLGRARVALEIARDRLGTERGSQTGRLVARRSRDAARPGRRHPGRPARRRSGRPDRPAQGDARPRRVAASRARRRSRRPRRRPRGRPERAAGSRSPSTPLCSPAPFTTCSKMPAPTAIPRSPDRGYVRRDGPLGADRRARPWARASARLRRDGLRALRPRRGVPGAGRRLAPARAWAWPS